MKRIKQAFLSLLLAVLMFSLISCGPSGQNSDMPNSSDPASLETEWFREVPAPEIDGHLLLNAGMLGENDFILSYKNKVTDQSYYYSTYRLNAKTGSMKLLYEGVDPSSYFALRVTKHPNGTYSIQFDASNIMFFDLKTDKLLKRIELEQYERPRDVIVLNSGEKLFYTCTTGVVCTSDLDFQNETVLYKPEGRWFALWPHVSIDGSKGAFTIRRGDTWDFMTCQVDLLTGELIFTEQYADCSHFPCNGQGLVTVDDGFVTDTPGDPPTIFRYFDFQGNEKSYYMPKKIIFSLGANQDSFVHFYDQGGAIRDCILCSWNVETGKTKTYDLGYQLGDLWALHVFQDDPNQICLMTQVVIPDDYSEYGVHGEFKAFVIDLSRAP